jgi:hypothetical protein
LRTLLLLALMALGNREPGPGSPELAGAFPAPGSWLPVLVVEQELIERTLALVGGQPITLSDARAAIAFGLVSAERSDDIPAITGLLVDRALILREVQRYAPPAPADAAVDARLNEIRARFRDAAGFTRALDLHGFSEARLRAWLRDDLRTVAYLAQRFASASTPTDTEISSAYTRSRAEFDAAGTTFEQATPVLRERLVTARRAELIDDWLSDLRRRTEVVIMKP